MNIGKVILSPYKKYAKVEYEFLTNLSYGELHTFLRSSGKEFANFLIAHAPSGFTDNLYNELHRSYHSGINNSTRSAERCRANIMDYEVCKCCRYRFPCYTRSYTTNEELNRR